MSIASKVVIIVAALASVLAPATSRAATAAPVPVPAVVDGVTLGRPANAFHVYGSCMVRDYRDATINGRDGQWVIVVDRGGGDYIVVRQGMLFGWFHYGGGAGALGCPTAPEWDPVPISGVRTAFQPFDHGNLYWVSGMNTAVAIGGTEWAALAAAWSTFDQDITTDAGYCLAFVEHSFAAAGVAMSPASTAAEYWTSNPDGFTEHPGDTSPAIGSALFWGPTPDNPAGHTGLYLGEDLVLSTASWPEGWSATQGHVFSFSGRNAAGYPYDGWVDPAQGRSVSVARTTTTSPVPTGIPETTGAVARTWTDYATGGGTEGASIPAYTTVDVTCRVQGLTVSDGNVWWYRVASSPWSDEFWVSADPFFNNGHTSGSLHATPFFDPNVPIC